MAPVILYRSLTQTWGRYIDCSNEPDTELATIHKYFPVVTQRIMVKPNNLVIGRYSVLPYYKELETDLELIGAKLINSYVQHRYVADLSNWTEDLKVCTPKTWLRLQDLPEGKSFVLKGETNSRKHLWNTHMFAKDRQAAIQVYSRLMDDTMLSQQPIYIREYVPLKKLDVGINGLPISVEFRVFVAYGKVLSGAFYWSSHISEEWDVPSFNLVPKDFLNQVIQIIGDKINFYALDVAQTENGDWTVVELNDGQMSGLSENDPDVLYRELSCVVNP